MSAQENVPPPSSSQPPPPPSSSQPPPPPSSSQPSSSDSAPGQSGADARTQSGVDARRPRLIFLLIGVLIAAGLGVGLFLGVGTPARGGSSGEATPPAAAGAGSPVPSFSLPRVGGSGSVGVPADGGGHGRPAILLFFASWCTPCQKEIPALASIYDHERSSGSRLDKVAVIGVDGNDPTNSALAFMHANGVTFPVGADSAYNVTQGKFGFAGLPESVFVKANGTIAGIHFGGLSSAKFVKWEHRLLASA